MVRLENITRRFGTQLVFERLDWMIPAGARLGLVGPNGAGKTTVLRLIADLERPDDGRIVRPGSLQVGYLSQEVETVEGGSVLTVVLGGFEQIREVEAQLAGCERAMAGLRPGDPELQNLSDRYGALRDRFEALGGDRVEARAKAILSGLGIPDAAFHESLGRLSGGWRMRVVLARLLLGAPGLLLLDEPTNHLDLEAIDWLEGFLAAYDGAFVVVSHDRYFLNRMVDGIVELEQGRLRSYPGNYDGYLREKELARERLSKAARQQQRERKKVERFIERFRYKNTKARQVQSRIRTLDKVERIELGPESRQIRFGFPPAPRSGDVVVRCERTVKRFGDNVVYDGLDLLLRRGDRVALVGPNGAGKSTLLKLLAGELAVDGGTVELGHNVVAQYYAQHQLDALDPANTMLQEMETVADPSLRPRLRTMLGSFLFSGDSVDKPVAVLSGGEKARLALCKMLVRPANLLLLDEPTNHLDLPSREVLEEALNQYGGTLVLISHDRYFINRVATSIAIVGGGRVEVHPGDYDRFLDWRRSRGDAAAGRAVEEVIDASTMITTGTGAEPDDKTARRLADRERKRAEAEDRNRRYRERRAVQQQLDPLEREITRLESRLENLAAMQADPEVYSDPEASARVGRERAEAAERLESLYERWEALAVRLPE